jgi:hypothetical protein
MRRACFETDNGKKPSMANSIDSSTALLMEDISDDDILLVDIHKHRTKPLQTSTFPSNQDSNVPLATDLQSTPGYNHDELRDLRFIIYNDIETLSMHFDICLSLDRESSHRLDYSRSYNLKTTSNSLKKIFKLYYFKTLIKLSHADKTSSPFIDRNRRQLPLSMIDSPTATSFQIDWNVNQRHGLSSRRQKPNNFFHILQLNPKKKLTSVDTCSTTTSSSFTPSMQANQEFERIKDILARTYYPHLHATIRSGNYFGSRVTFSNTQHLTPFHNDTVSIKEMPNSPDILDQSMTITLKSPESWSNTKYESLLCPSSPTIQRKRMNSSKHEKIDEPTCSSISIEHRPNETIDDISSVIIKQSFVLLSQPSIPIPSPPMIDRALNESCSQISRTKRKHTNNEVKPVTERKAKRFISSPLSTSMMSHIEDISESERYVFNCHCSRSIR